MWRREHRVGLLRRTNALRAPQTPYYISPLSVAPPQSNQTGKLAPRSKSCTLNTRLHTKKKKKRLILLLNSSKYKMSHLKKLWCGKQRPCFSSGKSWLAHFRFVESPSLKWRIWSISGSASWARIELNVRLKDRSVRDLWFQTVVVKEELKGKLMDSLVDQLSNSHLWSWDLETQDWGYKRLKGVNGWAVICICFD